MASYDWTVVHQVKDGDGPEPPENFHAHFGYREYAMRWIHELQRLGADRLGLYKEQRGGEPILDRKWGKFDDAQAW